MARAQGVYAWPADVVEAVARFKQGDLFQDPGFFYLGRVEGGLQWNLFSEGAQTTPAEDETSAAERETSAAANEDQSLVDVLELELEGDVYGVITSQTCDLDEQGEPAQPCFQAAPAYRLGENESGDDPLPLYLVPLAPPDLPEGAWVADVRLEIPCEKTLLVGQSPIAGFPDEDGYLGFASRLGRRRDRAALAAHLVEAVADTLRRLKSNNKRFRKALKGVQSVRLSIDKGTRSAPATVRVHVVSRGPIEANTRERFESWWDSTRETANSAGLELLPNAYHDGTAMDVDLYESLIDLGIT